MCRGMLGQGAYLPCFSVWGGACVEVTTLCEQITITACDIQKKPVTVPLVFCPKDNKQFIWSVLGWAGSTGPEAHLCPAFDEML